MFGCYNVVCEVEVAAFWLSAVLSTLTPVAAVVLLSAPQRPRAVGLASLPAAGVALTYLGVFASYELAVLSLVSVLGAAYLVARQRRPDLVAGNRPLAAIGVIAFLVMIVPIVMVAESPQGGSGYFGPSLALAASARVAALLAGVVAFPSMMVVMVSDLKRRRSESS